MRWFFLFVLALNLAYAGWHLTFRSDQPETVATPSPDVERIVLLRETAIKAVSEAASEVADTETGEQTADNGPDIVQQSANQPAVAAIASPGADVAADRPGSEPKPELQARLQPKQVGQAVSTPAEKQDEHVVSLAAPAGQDTEAASSRQENCFSLGPFRELEELRALTREISSYVVNAEFRGEEIEERSTYWVYIKPSASMEAAQEVTRKLKQNNINDFFIIREGDKKFGVSLGRFRSKSGAYGLAKTVGSQGFDVLVDPGFRNVTRYWLDYQLAEDARIPASVFDRHLPEDKGEFSRKSRVCE